MQQHLLNKTAVLKFGSSILTKEADITNAINEVYRYLRENYKVLVIISAIGNTTDVLKESVKQLFNADIEPQPAAYAELLASGEITAATLFTIALDQVGIPAKKLTHESLKTTGSLLDADPVSLNTETIFELFKQYNVLVLPGFIGSDAKTGDTALLGRGGSDLSAVFAAWVLKADICVLYKDTHGIYTVDPANNPSAQRYKTISYDDCLKLSYPVIQYKAVKLAQKASLAISVKTLNDSRQTLVNHKPSEVIKLTRNAALAPRRLKIALLGLGTVGLGVYHYLTKSKQFEIIGIGIKDPLKQRPDNVPKTLLTTDLSKLITQADIVIELLGTKELSLDLITQALQRKSHVVTANKALLAEHGRALSHLAETNGVKLFYSSAVGGSIPILEVLSHLKKFHLNNQIESVTGILNGTCNYVLDQIHQGNTFAAAIKKAQQAGFAEADPSLDINGIDTAQKLTIIARLAFNQDLNDVEVQGIQETENDAKNNFTKLIAQCEYVDRQLQASVKPTVIPNTHTLAGISGVNNCLLIKTNTGEVIQLHGKGAGRWPTAISVFADLLEVTRHIDKQQGNQDIIYFKDQRGVI